MKATKPTLFVLLFAIIASLFAGCSNSSNPPSASNPAVTSLIPADGATGVALDTAMTAALTLPNGVVDAATFNDSSIALTAEPSGAVVPVERSATGTTLTVQPTALLAGGTTYKFSVTAGLKDTSGAPFVPFESRFTTASKGTPPRQGLTGFPAGGLVFSAPTGKADTPQPLTLTNSGNAPLTISGLELSDSTSFALRGAPSLPITVAPGAATTLTVGFNALTVGPKNATLTVQSDGVAAAVVALHGLSFKGTGGNNEPSLQWILDALAIPVEVGDSDPTTTPIDGPTGGFVGEEIAAQTFRKAGSGAVTVEVLAAFAVENDPVVRFGWYRAGDASTTRAVFEVPQTSPNTPPNNAQRLMPDVTGTLSFDPGSAPFGLYAFWPSNQFFDTRTTYTEDTLNTFPKALPHHFRTFPYKNADGTVEPNVYIVTNNEFHLGDDFNDVVVIVRNVTPL